MKWLPSFVLALLCALSIASGANIVPAHSIDAIDRLDEGRQYQFQITGVWDGATVVLEEWSESAGDYVIVKTFTSDTTWRRFVMGPKARWRATSLSSETELSPSHIRLKDSGKQTAEDLATIISGDPQTVAAALDIGAELSAVDGLANYRRTVAVNNYTRTSILYFGDSMIGQALQDIRLMNANYLDETDMAWADGGVTGTGVLGSDNCRRWVNGIYYNLPSSTATVTFGNSVSFPISGNTLKVYYFKKSGGGTFKIQQEQTVAGATAAWADITSTRTGGTTTGTNSSPNITFTSSGVIPPTGTIVTGTNIPANTYVVSATLTTAVLSQNASAAGSGITFTFTGDVNTANASDASGVATIPMTNVYKGQFRVRCVWVSGDSDIIGAGVIDTNRYGAKVAVMYNGSNAINNIDNASQTAAAVVNPVMADLAPQLVVMSHLDGAAFVNSYQDTLQNKFNTAITSGGASLPSWIVVGPPAGYDDTQDEANAAQAAAQKALAISRDDVFFDNRLWMGSAASAVANGYLPPGDVHPTAKARAYWLPSLFRQAGIADGLTLGPVRRTAYPLLGGGNFRTQAGALGISKTVEFEGDIRMTSAPGTTGAARLFLEDNDATGPANSNDVGFWQYSGNTMKLGIAASQALNFDVIGGQTRIWNPNSSPGSSTAAGSPNGSVGAYVAPMRETFTYALNLGYIEKTGAYTLTSNDHFVNATAGSWTMTLPSAVNAMGRTYVLMNTGSGTTITIATTSSQTIDGAAPGSIAAGGRLRVVSNNANWLTW